MSELKAMSRMLPARARLAGLLDRAVTHVRRINYVLPGGDRNPREGPIEITLDGDLILQLDSGSDGESLRVVIGQWEDPFVEPMTPENRQFVKESGKWTAFDVSDEEGYRMLIGQRVQGLSLITLMGKISGIELVVGPALLKAEVEGDELLVDCYPARYRIE